MIFKCKMCGGTIEFEPGSTVGVCEYCGTKQTLPKLDDDKKANLYDRANHFRRSNDFDKAANIYEQILAEDNTDCEAYWSLVLCRYGIEYVEDPTTHSRIPTVNRAQFTSIYADEDYKSAIEYADNYQKEIYELEAKQIDEIQKGILAISNKEEPFDIFICYKETDNNGRRTIDSVLANDLYHQLVQEGFKVFFSRITLEDKLGTAYEPYIFAALNSSKVMVVLGTKPEYFNAVWVKNEWSRYLSLVKQSKGKKVLIPAYRDMDPYDLPEEFSHLQALDMSKLGFMQDLIRGIKKIIQTDTSTSTIKEIIITNNNNTNTAPLLKGVFMFLEDGNWQKADEYCEKVLDIDPENAEAYLYKLLVDYKIIDMESMCFVNFKEPLETNKNYKKAIQFGSEKLKKELLIYNDESKKSIAASKAITKKVSAKTIEEYEEAYNELIKLGDYPDADFYADECLEEIEKLKNKIYQNAIALLKDAKTLDDFEMASKQFLKIADYKDSKERSSYCLEKAKECRKNAEELAKSVVVTLTNIGKIKELDEVKEQYCKLLEFQETFSQILSEYNVLQTNKKALEETIHSLEEKKSHLGIFAFNEKKATEEKIQTKQRELSSLNQNITNKKLSMNGYSSEEQLNNVINDLNNKITTLEDQFEGVKHLGVSEAKKILNNNKDVQSVVLKINTDLSKFLFNVGNIINFGEFGGRKIEWKILDVVEDKALLICNDILCKKEYNESYIDVTWQTCSLRSWLNNDFYNSSFNAHEQNRIIPSRVIPDKNKDYSTNQGTVTYDKIFLLSIDEVKKYFKYFDDRKCRNFYWLRTIGSKQYFAAYVDSSGDIDSNGRGVYNNFGVRPALWINLES